MAEQLEKMDKKRHYWILSLIVGIFAVAVLATVGTVGVFQLFIYKPSEAYYAMETNEWAPVNVKMMAFSSQADFNTAEKKLYKALSKPSEQVSPIPYYLLASLFDYQGQADKALETYNATLQVANKDWYSSTVNQYFTDDVHAAKALIYYEQDKKQQAIAELDQIKDLESQTDHLLLSSLKNVLDEPKRGDFHFDLAKALRHMLKLGLSSKELALAMTLTTDPSSRDAIYNFQHSKMPAKVQELSPLLRYYSLAASAQEDKKEGGNLELAATLYEQVIKEQPDFEWAYQQLALVQKELNRPDQAAQYAEKALAINPDFYLSHMTLADLALSKENYPAAIDHFTQARRLLSKYPDDEHMPLIVNVENQLGFTEELMENAPAAISHYQMAMTMANDDASNDDDDYDYARTGLKRAKSWLLTHRQDTKVLADKMPGKN